MRRYLELFTNALGDRTVVCEYGASGIPAWIAQQTDTAMPSKQLGTSTLTLFTFVDVNTTSLLRRSASLNLVRRHRPRITNLAELIPQRVYRQQHNSAPEGHQTLLLHQDTHRGMYAVSLAGTSEPGMEGTESPRCPCSRSGNCCRSIAAEN